MRNFRLLAASFIAFMLLALQGCQGPEGLPGPQGPQGPEGPPGPNIFPAVFEVGNVNFLASADYRVSITMPSNLEVLPSDVVLTYILWDEVEVNGSLTDLWRLLPQIVPSGNGFFQYNYDFTQYDVEVFMNGTVNLSTLDNSWTRNQVLRVVVVPADFLNGRVAPVDFSSYEEVIKAFDIDDSNVLKLSAN